MMVADDARTDRDGEIKAARPSVREAHDAEDHPALKVDPSNADARLDIALDESFPTSDASGHAAPGTGEPASSSGYDEEAERRLLARRERAYAIWEHEGRPDGQQDEHWIRAEGEDGEIRPGSITRRND